MMRQMRENTKWIMLITALAFVGLMIFEWGMDASGRSGGGMAGAELGRVNGEAVTYEQFLTVYRNLYQQQQMAMDGPITGALNRQIEEAAWEQLVMQRLIQQELRRRGIAVTAAEIRQAARFAPPPEFLESDMFLTNGEFDLARYHQFLASPAVDNQLLLQLEAYYREVIPRSKLYYQATTGVFISDDELWRMYRDTREQATIRFVTVDPEVIVGDDEVSVSDTEVRTYYRANPDLFRREARASIRYVALERAPTRADTAAVHARAQALRAEIEAGASFSELARRESADAGSAEDGGRLVITRGQTVPPFEDAAFSLPPGQVSEPVQTQFGYHLIRVESRTDEQATVQHILLPIEMSPDAEDRLYQLADSLEALGARLSLDDAAAAMELTVRTGEITPEMPFVPQAGMIDEGADWAFEDADIGEVSPLYESPAAFYMLELVARQDEGVVSLQEATPQIRATLMSRKKIERAQARVAEVLQAGADGALERVADRFNVDLHEAGPFTRADFVPGLGRMNAPIGAAFGLAVGQLSAPLHADGRVHVVRLVERQEADRDEWEAQRDEQRQRVTPRLTEQRWNQFLTALRDQADIRDNRAQVLRRGGQPDDPIARR